MAAKLNYAAMAKELVASLDEKKHAAFLREQSLAGDHSFLLASIERSNLRPSVRKVVEELITGKLRRPKQRPRSDDTDLNNARRALRRPDRVCDATHIGNGDGVCVSHVTERARGGS